MSRDGRSTRIGWIDNPLGIRAEAVEYRWIGDDEPDLLKQCRCKLVYLGRSTGTAVLFDATNRRTLRVPDAQLALIDRRSASHPAGPPELHAIRAGLDQSTALRDA